MCGPDVCGDSMDEKCVNNKCTTLTEKEFDDLKNNQIRCPQGDELIQSTCQCGSNVCTPGFFCDSEHNGRSTPITSIYVNGAEVLKTRVASYSLSSTKLPIYFAK